MSTSNTPLLATIYHPADIRGFTPERLRHRVALTSHEAQKPIHA